MPDLLAINNFYITNNQYDFVVLRMANIFAIIEMSNMNKGLKNGYIYIAKS